ncbi:CWF19-like protein 1 [Harmonia axyridis]|uniref:CWF19-like protein 1 n=1 Tax=Harmonia axyridis TaxID=115357 RepID=UPI001E279A95|nr:CWF19-like protein 1 [Harmonia axyridis]
MGSADKKRILLCGDVEGKFNALFKKINSIIKKSGQFDMLICVGNFFGINNKEFDEYKLGNKKVPLPTYILGPNKADHVNMYPEEDEELCTNLFYLGKRGLYTGINGLRITYVSGISSSASKEPFNYDTNDISELFDLCVRGNPAFRGVDILLTSQWPAQMLVDPEKTKPLYASALPNWLIMKLKPRYVVSGLEGKYYERPPMRIPTLGDNDSTVEIATRFIGLGRVDNKEGAKWLYALNLTPIDKMKLSELIQKTTDETPCPFTFDDLQSAVFQVKKSSGTKQYFYDTTPIEEPKAKKQKREKITFDQEKCWFCLASPSVEKHLIITIGDHCYMALAKGGLVEEHFLICPIQHYQNSVNQPEPVRIEMNQFKKALVKFYQRESKVPIFFERNYKTSHMQLQVIPIPEKAQRELKDIFMDEAEANGFNLTEADSFERLEEVLPPKTPYFLVELPSGTVLYNTIKGNFPINFGREVLCTGPVLNLPDRTEWKECCLGKEEEIALVERIRTDFEPFDFTI